MTRRPLHPVRRIHLGEISGPLGIWQHAVGTVPDEAHGYCTDDVARALMVDLLHRYRRGWDPVRHDARRSLAFLRAAWDPTAGAFRNFRAADGRWLEASGSQDSQGRALLALGVTSAQAPDAELRAEARTLFEDALPGAARLTALRAISSAILGCDAALSGRLTATRTLATTRMLDDLAARLFAAFGTVGARAEWPWPEPILTYENALLPRALLAAGLRLRDPAMRAMGLRVLDWLLEVQTEDGVFSPIGSNGWWPRNGQRSRFDQQPIEATATILAAELAHRATLDPRYRLAAEAAYGWFLGDNDVGLALADTVTGGCHDGLSAGGVNANQGAESTLMWQIALATIGRLRSGSVPEAVVRGPVTGTMAAGAPA